MSVHVCVCVCVLSQSVAVCVQVFLKYYHVEELARLYENLTRRVVMVQSVVRSWMARTRFYKMRWERQKAAVTVQKCNFYWHFPFCL